MKKLALAALAFGAAASFVTPATASAPANTDLLCGFTSATDPNPEAPENTQTGELDGGPITQNGTITCTIQVGNAGLHTDPDNGAKASATGTNGVTTLNPTLVSYTSPPNTNVYLCDQFTDASNVTYVFDDVDGAWEAAAGNTTAACRLAISAGTDDPLIQGIEEAIDGVICPVLAGVGPAGVAGVAEIQDDGDIAVAGDELWLCPPYES